MRRPPREVDSRSRLGVARLRAISHRHIKNRRLAAVGPIWALGSLRSSPGARRHYDARRAAGDWNHQAQRHLFNKFLGQLHHCLQTGQLYNERRAFPPPLPLAA